MKGLALHGVLKSTVLNGASIWGAALSHAKYREMVDRVQRKVLLRVIIAYGTTMPVKAAQVIAGAVSTRIGAQKVARE